MPSENELKDTSNKNNEETSIALTEAVKKDLNEGLAESNLLTLDEAYAIAKSRGCKAKRDTFRQHCSRNKSSSYFGIKKTRSHGKYLDIGYTANGNNA